MSVCLQIDHLVISCEHLDDGVALVEDALSVRMEPGGQHPQMGTHNRLLGLGDVYLEVIAIDPSVTVPVRPRWFGLDRFTGPPRLTNWVARVSSLSIALESAPVGTGEPMQLSRGELVWKIAISADGTLPFDGAFPGLIDWGDAVHPVRRLPDSGCRLDSLTVTHPDSNNLIEALSRFGGGLGAYVKQGPEVAMTATIQSPGGSVAFFQALLGGHQR